MAQFSHRLKAVSLPRILTLAKRLITRFPFALLAAALLTGSLLAWIHDLGDEAVIRSLLLSSLVALPLLGAAELFGERNTKAPHPKLFAVTALTASAGYYVYLASAFDDGFLTLVYVQTVLLFFAAILALFLVNAGRDPHEERLWLFGKHVVTSMSAGFVVALVVQIGITLALSAISALFGTDISRDIHLSVPAIAYGLLMPAVTLALIPRYADMHEDARYPKRFGQLLTFVLLPLLALFAVILSVYGLGILFEWQLPKESVVTWILWFALTGIVVFAAAYPLLLPHAKNRIFKRAFLAFNTLMIPFLLLYAISIWVRIDSYGFTEKRVAIVYLGALLLLNIACNLAKKRPRFSFLPGTLLIGILLFTLSPLGGYQLAFESQAQRFESLLRRNDILVNGQITPRNDIGNRFIHAETQSVLRYLVTTYGAERLADHFRHSSAFGEENAGFFRVKRHPGEAAASHRYSAVRTIMQRMHGTEGDSSARSSAAFFQASPQPVRTRGYTHAIQISLQNYGARQGKETVAVNDRELELSLEQAVLTIEAVDRDAEPARIDFSHNLEQLPSGRTRPSAAETPPMILRSQTPSASVELHAHQLQAVIEGGAWSIRRLQGLLLLTMHE